MPILPEKDTLETGKPHPAAKYAQQWIASQDIHKLHSWLEAFASTAIEGNHCSEICVGTLNRLLKGEPVSDRYILGLAWVMKYGDDDKNNPAILK